MLGLVWAGLVQTDGTWRSLVARTLGVREVAGSNPAVPIFSLFHFCRWLVVSPLRGPDMTMRATDDLFRRSGRYC